MDTEDEIFLRDFFRAVADRPLEPDEDAYIPIYENESAMGSDPVKLLARGIAWTRGHSVQLLSGYRGAVRAPSSGV
jgi:hypothetical protein